MLKTFTLILPDQMVHGEPIPGYVTFKSTDSVMTLMVTEEIATAEYPSHELVSMLADICGIEKQSHVTLLSTALCKLSVKSTNTAFLQQGVRVEGLLLGTSLSLEARASKERADRPSKTTQTPKIMPFIQPKESMRHACLLRCPRRRYMV
jgi:hypothetical protein